MPRKEQTPTKEQASTMLQATVKEQTKPKSAELVQTQIINRENVVSPNFFSIYANDVQVQTSPWDVRLIFGEISRVATPEKPVMEVKQLGELRVSPQLAKRLAMIFIDQLRAYEERIGEIPLPPD